MEILGLSLIVMCLTLVVVMGIGIYSSRKVKSAEGFSVSARRAGVPLVAGSIAGTCVGGGATVGTAQLAASVGLSAWWFTLGIGIGMVILGIFYAYPMRKTGLETIPQFLRLHYGLGAEIFISVVSSLGILFSAVASALSGIFILKAVFGTEDSMAAFILFVLVMFYAFFGGMKSAGVGGILKMVIIWLTLVIAGFSAGQMLFFEPTMAEAVMPGAFDLFDEGGETILSNLLSMVVGIVSTQSYIQALFSASTPRTAAVGAFTAAAIVLPIGLPCALVGMYMHAADPSLPAILVLPAFLFEHQPALLGGIAMGGILLSVIGSVAGLSLGIGAMVSRDIIFRLFHGLGAALQLHIMRAVVLAAVVLASTIALFHEDSEILFWTYLSMALRGGGVFLPLTIAIRHPHAIAPNYAIASMVLSTLIAVASALIGTPIKPIFLGLAVSAFIFLLGYFRRKDRSALRM